MNKKKKIVLFIISCVLLCFSTVTIALLVPKFNPNSSLPGVEIEEINKDISGDNNKTDPGASEEKPNDSQTPTPPPTTGDKPNTDPDLPSDTGSGEEGKNPEPDKPILGPDDVPDHNKVIVDYDTAVEKVKIWLIENEICVDSELFDWTEVGHRYIALNRIDSKIIDKLESIYNTTSGAGIVYGYGVSYYIDESLEMIIFEIVKIK